MTATAVTLSAERRSFPPVLKGRLSANRRRLVELMQELNFGRLEGIRVSDAEPVLDPAPGILREIKFGGENGPRLELSAGDFVLKWQVIEMFAHLDNIRDCHIEVLEVKHGLPFRMLIREMLA